MRYAQDSLITGMTHRLSKLTLIFMLGALAACAALIPSQYLLSQQKLQDKLQSSFPIKQELGNGMFSVMLNMPLLGFDVAHNRVSISSGFSAYTILSAPVQGNLKMSGALRFDAGQRAIFLQDPLLDNLTILQDDSYADLLRPALNMVLVEYLRVHPLYRFQADELRYAGADVDITGIDVVPDGISVKLSPKRPRP